MLSRTKNCNWIMGFLVPCFC